MTEFTHAAVSVFAAGSGTPEALLGELAACVKGAGVEVAQGRVLDGTALAVDLSFSSRSPDGAERVRTLIAHEFSALADTAVLPLGQRRKRLLISDMDSTIIGQECLDELADYAGLKAEISAITERAMRGELDFEGALTERVAMLKGLDLGALAQCYAERIRLLPGATTLVATMKAHGARCILVSGGFTYFTSRVAEAAGFETHRGNTLLDDGNALTGEVARPILGREAKLDALREEADVLGINLSETLAIGDGANDLAMIKAAGLGIAFHAKPVVAAEADAAITRGDLRSVLWYQGYTTDEFENA